MNQLISAAVGEKLAALMTLEYLEERRAGKPEAIRGGFEACARRGA